jgi:hypothetical protein
MGKEYCNFDCVVEQRDERLILCFVGQGCVARIGRVSKCCSQ